MSCGCNKNGSTSTTALKLFGGRRGNSRAGTRKKVIPKRRRRKSRAMRGGNFFKSLVNVSSSVSPGVHPASQKFGLGHSYMV